MTTRASLKHRSRTAVRWVVLLSLAAACGGKTTRDRGNGTLVQGSRRVVVGGTTGESASYAYDPGGNILRVRSMTAPTLSVSGFEPFIGGAGQRVTVTGTGFCTSPSTNAVTVNGTPAASEAATANQLTFRVPIGATTGPVSVSCGSDTVVSAGSFTVVSGVVVSDFAPKVGAAGTAITINGYNFDPEQANDAVRVGVGTASVSVASFTTLRATVGSDATSGKIRVSVAGVTGASSADFFMVPASYAPQSVGWMARLAPGEDSVVSLPTPGQIGLAIFDGSRGEGLALHVSGSSFGASATIALYAPAGALVQSWTVTSDADTKLVPADLPADGTYSVVIQPPTGATGALHLQLWPDAVVPLQVGGDAVAMSLAAGQNGRYAFTAAAGDALGIGYPILTASSGGSLALTVRAPDGSAVGQTTSPTRPGSNQLSPLPTSGPYTLVVRPSGTSSASLSVLLSPQITGTIATDGAPTTFQTARVGQAAVYTFSGVAGQSYTIEVTTQAAFANGGTVVLKKPGGSSVTLASLSSSAPTNAKADLGVLSATGTYGIAATPSDLSTGTLTLRVIPQAAGALTIGAAPVTLALGEAQNGRYTFTGAAGDLLNLVVTAVSATPTRASVAASILNPAGSSVKSATITAPATIQLPQLTTAGTYTLSLAPQGTAAASLTLQLVRR